MSLFLASINSGSNGNCYYVGNDHDAVLIDAGISCREIEKRMERLALSMRTIRAIFISHEHSDHIRGVEVLSKKHRIPVFITPSTHINSNLNIKPELLNNFNAFDRVNFGNIEILAFPKSHDASDPHSFMVSAGGINVGVLTDIGHPCKHVIDIFKECHAVFLEANYDEKMLQEGPYPFYLKKRISSDQGHLSNDQALDLYLRHGREKVRQLILTHLSKENNSPQLVHKLFAAHAPNANVFVASRDYESQVVHITLDEKSEVAVRHMKVKSDNQVHFEFDER